MYILWSCRWFSFWSTASFVTFCKGKTARMCEKSENWSVHHWFLVLYQAGVYYLTWKWINNRRFKLSLQPMSCTFVLLCPLELKAMSEGSQQLKGSSRWNKNTPLMTLKSTKNTCTELQSEQGHLDAIIWEQPTTV